MFGFVDQGAADAAMRGEAERVAEYLDANPNQLDNRTIFQSTLLHIAARNGRLQVALELLNRGIDVNALDYGGMRRTALHWACQGGHVSMVELLMEFGADTKVWCSHDILLEQLQVQGKSWSKLVQGRKCGRLISSDDAIDKSPSQVCSNNSVRLALERPVWTPEINHMFPPRFKEMVRVVLQSLECRGDPEAAGAASQPPEADSLHAHGLMAAVHIGCPARHDGAHAAIAAAASEEGQPAADACGSSESAPHPGAHCRLRTPLPCAAAPAGQADHGGNTLTADGARPLSWDSCQQIIALAAYPISAWL